MTALINAVTGGTRPVTDWKSIVTPVVSGVSTGELCRRPPGGMTKPMDAENCNKPTIALHIMDKVGPNSPGRDSTLVFAETCRMRGDLMDEEWGIIGGVVPRTGARLPPFP